LHVVSEVLGQASCAITKMCMDICSKATNGRRLSR
jgi:hypothetical protein